MSKADSSKNAKHIGPQFSVIAMMAWDRSQASNEAVSQETVRHLEGDAQRLVGEVGFWRLAGVES